MRILIVILLMSYSAYCEDDPLSMSGEQEMAEPAETKPPTKSSKSSSKENVLDFEAEVVEGERKNPNLFLQMEVDTPNLEALLYQRDNFQDFQAAEKKRRPMYRFFPKK